MNLFFSLQQGPSFLDACNLGWLPFLLGLLLPFLLGWLFGRALWHKYKGISEGLEAEVNKLNSHIAGLDADLEACRRARLELDSDNARMNGEIRELKMALEEESRQNLSNAEELIALKDAGGVASATGLGIVGKAADEVEVISDESLANAKAVFGKKIKANDLKVIEGVGPKIEGLLKDAGLETWKKVALSKSERLADILKAAGSRYTMHNPKTWPEQSHMAWKGQWENLKQWQDDLDGGV